MKSLNPFERGLVLFDQDYATDSWNNFFKDFGSFDRPVFRAQKTKNTFEPTCDITEAKDHYLIAMDVPGIEQKDLTIEVENNQLKISGERVKEVTEKDDTKQVYFERSFGKFVRTFNLPAEINIEDIQAHHQDGVLKVAIPKAKKVEAKKITINSNQGNGLFQKLVGTVKKEA